MTTNRQEIAPDRGRAQERRDRCLAQRFRFAALFERSCAPVRWRADAVLAPELRRDADLGLDRLDRPLATGVALLLVGEDCRASERRGAASGAAAPALVFTGFRAAGLGAAALDATALGATDLGATDLSAIDVGARDLSAPDADVAPLEPASALLTFEAAAFSAEAFGVLRAFELSIDGDVTTGPDLPPFTAGRAATGCTTAATVATVVVVVDATATGVVVVLPFGRPPFLANCASANIFRNASCASAIS